LRTGLRGEHYAVITFNNEVEIIKPIEKEMPIEALLDRMLEIQPKEITNIKLARRERARTSSQNRSFTRRLE